MSASREKRPARLDLCPAAQQQSGGKKQPHARGLWRGRVVIAVLAIALLVWDSGFFQKRTTAVTIDGEDFTPAVVQYYYHNAMTETLYYAQMGMNTGFDSSVDPKDQVQGRGVRHHLV